MTARSPESHLKAAVLSALAAIGVLAISNAKAGRRYRAGLDDGSPDIVCVLPPLGCLVGLELKVDTKQSRTQLAWQRRHESLGGLYFVVHSPVEAVEAIAKAQAHIRSCIRGPS